MKKLTAYEWLVIALSLLFLLCCLVGYFGWRLHSRLSATDWQVQVQQKDTPPSAPSTSGPNTDGLLPGEVINLNTATRSDLLRLPDIGAARADAILAYRDANGPFPSVDDLLQVSGIGPAILEILRPYICVT